MFLIAGYCLIVLKLFFCDVFFKFQVFAGYIYLECIVKASFTKKKEKLLNTIGQLNKEHKGITLSTEQSGTKILGSQCIRNPGRECTDTTTLLNGKTNRIARQSCYRSTNHHVM